MGFAVFPIKPQGPLSALAGNAVRVCEAAGDTWSSGF